METVSYFAYGSNMLSAWLQTRCRSARVRGIASVDGYLLAFTKGSKDRSGKAMLLPSKDPSARLYGVLYDISNAEMAELDRSEGRGKGYERVQTFEVRSIPDDKSIRATTYLASVTSADYTLTPYDWYLDLVIKGAEQHGLPDEYVAALSARTCLPDSIADRPTRVQAFGVLARLKQHGVALRSRANVRIAGESTVGDWVVTRTTLTVAKDQNAWRGAYIDFFLARLRSRYFRPIELLQEVGTESGEGFAITAIQCSLIEFLGATLKGQSYVHPSELNGRKKSGLEYTSSGRMFVEFLRTSPPFNEIFVTNDLAWDFYHGVRCGLLHEARTKHGWTIRTRRKPGLFLDVGAKIVYRDDLQTAFETFASWYGAELLKDKNYQEAFIRKFDSLCAD